MPELTLELDISSTSRALRGALVFSLLVGLAGDLASESVTLTTFYPAPSGVYSQLVASQNVYLARDAYVNPGAPWPAAGNPSSVVEVGTFSTPVSPSLARLVVKGGLVGIGTTSLSPIGGLGSTTGPGCPLGLCPALQIYDNVGNTTPDLLVNGRILTGDPLNLATLSGGICLNTTCTQVVGYAKSADLTNNFGLINMNGGPVGLMMVLSSVGIGFPGAGTAPGPSNPIANDPIAPLDINGTINLPNACALGVVFGYLGTKVPPNPTEVPQFCPAGNYATYRPGLMTYYQTSSDHTDDTSGTMWCCPCPGGVCSL